LEALRLSYDKYISPLLVHTHFLPIGIAAELRRVQSNYMHAQESGISGQDAGRMASELMAILRQMTPLLRTEPLV